MGIIKKPKRMVVISDLHCGHKFGLTPPGWWSREDAVNSKIVSRAGEFQRALWEFYSKAVEKYKPVDLLIINGDAIDGKGERSGSVELITTDRHEQVRMAKVAIELFGASKVRIIYGTRYHTGTSEDFESVLADSIDCEDVEVQGHGFFEINGCVIDIKHKVSSSTIPHGRMTALARARLWNVVWNSEHEKQPKANLIIRSHVHYHNFCGSDSWMGLTTPALCYNSSYGVRECEGLVDVGFVVFNFDKDGEYDWNTVNAEFDALKVRSESL